MLKTKQRLPKLVGLAGALACLVIFIHEPSFPTPDKLIVFLSFVFLYFGKFLEGSKRFGPFILLMLIYESFRGVADQLNKHVHYSLPSHIDHLLFGNLPTIYLQNWLWHGHTTWYDFVLYLPYFLHFVIPLALGLLIWHNRDKYFWQVMNTFLVVAFAAFATFLIFPAAPPWLATQNHYIQPITRISSQVWDSLGIHDFPSLYHHISPNAVAAVPSLHAAWATLLFIFVYKLYGRRWGLVAAIYPFLIFFGTIYEGEHYAFDIMAGIVYAVGGYLLTPWLMEQGFRLFRVFRRGRSSNTKSA